MPDGDATPRQDVVDDALAGLLAHPKTLPPKLFYDAEGCRLFGRITQLPEYYLTRTELALLKRIAPAVAKWTPDSVALVEYGAGSEAKAAILLNALRRPAAYVPIDIASEALAQSRGRLSQRFPTLVIYSITADFTVPFCLPTPVAVLPRLGFFPGSTIGNFEPSAAVDFLRQARRTLGAGAMLLVGADLRKDAAILLPAYDDVGGVTAAFNRNVLTRLNREAGADFVPDAFQHRAIWNEQESRIEMHLVSRYRQVVHLAGRTIAFSPGESIHTENSYKHTAERLTSLAGNAGWEPVQLWKDADDLFSVHLWKADQA